jgi:hypothetical protein
MTDFRTHRWLALAVALCTLAPADALAGPVQPPAAASPKKATDQDWLQRLRQLLHLQPVEAVGGSRGQHRLKLCLLSPVAIPTHPVDSSDAHGGESGMLMVPVTTPMLVTSQPLSEIVLEENGAVLWQELASSRQPLSPVRHWPIAPIQPGQQLILKLRAEGSGGSDYALFRLQLADNATIKMAQALQQAVATNPSGWQRRLKHAAVSGDHATAAILLSSPAPWQHPPRLNPQQLCSGV